MSSADDEIRSGWMTTRDAELFGVLARRLTDDERRQVAGAITWANDEADQQVRRSRAHDPTAAEKEPRCGRWAGWATPRIPSRRGLPRDRAVDPVV